MVVVCALLGRDFGGGEGRDLKHNIGLLFGVYGDIRMDCMLRVDVHMARCFLWLQNSSRKSHDDAASEFSRELLHRTMFCYPQ